MLMCENELKPEPCCEKGELRSRTHENQELRTWSHVHEKKSSSAGAVPFLRQFHSPAYAHSIHYFSQNSACLRIMKGKNRLGQDCQLFLRLLQCFSMRQTKQRDYHNPST